MLVGIHSKTFGGGKS